MAVNADNGGVLLENQECIMMKEILNFQTHPLGVHTGAVLLPVIGQPEVVDVSVGPGVARWNVKDSKRISYKQIHNSLILDMSRYGEYVLTVGHDGQVRVFTEDWKEVCKAPASAVGPVALARWSHCGKFAVTISRVTMWHYKNSVMATWHFDEESCCLTQLAEQTGNYRKAEWTERTQILCWDSELPVLDLLNVNLQFVVSCRPMGIIHSGIVLPPLKPKTPGRFVATSQRQEKQSVLIDFCVLNMRTLDKIAGVFSMKAKKRISAFAACGPNHIVFSDAGCSLSIMKIETWEIVARWKGPPGDILSLVFPVGLKSRVFLLTVESIYSLRVPAFGQELSEEKAIDIPWYGLRLFDLSCSGIAFSPDGEFVVAGDLTGTVIIFDHVAESFCSDYDPFASCRVLKVPGSVRCIKFISNNWLLVGTLSDGVFSIEVKTGKTCCSFQTFYDNGACSTSTAFSISPYDNQLAVATTSGHIYVLYVTIKSDLEIVFKKRFLAHAAQVQKTKEKRENFGSLHRAADVWTVSWSPDGRLLATGSEDQSIKIWDCHSGFRLVQTIREHAKAVTCLEWGHIKTQKDKEEILCSCSDDRSIKLFETKTWTLITTFKPENIPGWYTFTYLKLDSASNVLVCGSENGYLSCFDIFHEVQLCGTCIHRGSIEGLAWDFENNIIATCSSDCCIFLHKLVETDEYHEKSLYSLL